MNTSPKEPVKPFEKTERQQARARARMPDLKDATAKLHADLTAMAAEQKFEVGPLTTFGLEFEVYDPETSLIFSPARANHRDHGLPGILMTPEAVLSDITTIRQHQRAKAPELYPQDTVAA